MLNYHFTVESLCNFDSYFYVTCCSLCVFFLLFALPFECTHKYFIFQTKKKWISINIIINIYMTCNKIFSIFQFNCIHQLHLMLFIFVWFHFVPLIFKLEKSSQRSYLIFNQVNCHTSKPIFCFALPINRYNLNASIFSLGVYFEFLFVLLIIIFCKACYCSSVR